MIIIAQSFLTFLQVDDVSAILSPYAPPPNNRYIFNLFVSSVFNIRSHPGIVFKDDALLFRPFPFPLQDVPGRN